MKTICFSCNEYPPYKNGGIGSFVKGIAEGLKKEGLKSIVIGLYEIKKIKISKSNGVLLIRIPKSHLFVLSPIINSIKFYIILNILEKRLKIDVFEENDWDLNSSFIPKLKGVKYILRLHHGRISKIKKLSELGIIQAIKLHIALFNSSMIIGVSNCVLEGYKRFFPNYYNKFIVIYNGIEIPDLDNNIKRNRFCIFFAGTLSPNKGVINLAKSLIQINDKFGGELILIVAGKDGNYKGEKVSLLLKNICANSNLKFKYLGHLSKVKLEYFYQSAGIFALPSKFESFGLAVAEAMSYGCPVVFTNNTSGPEIIDDGIDGFLIDPENLNNIAEKILILLNDDNIYNNFRVNSREKIKSKFNSSLMIKKNYNLYTKLFR